MRLIPFFKLLALVSTTVPYHSPNHCLYDLRGRTLHPRRPCPARRHLVQVGDDLDRLACDEQHGDGHQSDAQAHLLFELVPRCRGLVAVASVTVAVEEGGALGGGCSAGGRGHRRPTPLLARQLKIGGGCHRGKKDYRWARIRDGN